MLVVAAVVCALLGAAVNLWIAKQIRQEWLTANKRSYPPTKEKV